MTFISQSRRPLVFAAVLSAVALGPLLADPADVDVVDPVTGDTVALADIDFSALTDAQRADIGDQLAELGVSPRGPRGDRPERPDLSEVEVVDPTTGETVALGDIDKSALSAEDRADIGAQLSELGYERGPRGRRGGREEASDEDSPADDTAETETETETATAAASDDGDAEAAEGRGRGGPGRGGRGGPRG